MPIRVALNHKTIYRYDRQVAIFPQIVRLKPASHSRTTITSYSLKVRPAKHFVNWQQDPYGNFLARFVFPEAAKELAIEVDLVAEMTVINPFDFFLEPAAESIPFEYDPWLKEELKPFLAIASSGPLFAKFFAGVEPHVHSHGRFPRRAQSASAKAGRLCHPLGPRHPDLRGDARKTQRLLPR